MRATNPPWAVVLAGGDGTRLRSLTVGSGGRTVPKQYCSLAGGESLLRLALLRAGRVAPAYRIVTIVAEQHEPWWRPELEDLPHENVVVQPANRGTAPGVLLPVLRVLRRDPGATFVVLPSDHFILDEEALGGALERALAASHAAPDTVVLLGMTPDEIDPQFGWILPALPGRDGVVPVDCFVEKPASHVAEELLRQGGVWNSFIFVARGAVLLRLFAARLPEVLRALDDVERSGLAAETRDRRLRAAYAALGTSDFCRDLLQGSEERLRMLPVPPCGWSDLGTAERVLRCLETAHARAVAASPARVRRPAPLALDRALERHEPVPARADTIR